MVESGLMVLCSTWAGETAEYLLGSRIAHCTTDILDLSGNAPCRLGSNFFLRNGQPVTTSCDPRRQPLTGTNANETSFGVVGELDGMVTAREMDLLSFVFSSCSFSPMREVRSLR